MLIVKPSFPVFKFDLPLLYEMTYEEAKDPRYRIVFYRCPARSAFPASIAGSAESQRFRFGDGVGPENRLFPENPGPANGSEIRIKGANDDTRNRIRRRCGNDAENCRGVWAGFSTGFWVYTTRSPDQGKS